MMVRRRIPRVFAAIVLASSLAATAPVVAQQEPAVLLTAKSAGEVIGDLRYLLSSLAPKDDPRSDMALQALDGLKDPAALKGIDPAKPLGVYATAPAGPGEMPGLVAFIPVLDAKAFLAALEGFGATIDDKAGVEGFSHKIDMPGANAPVYALNAGGYLFLSLAPTGADALKAMKPATLLPTRPGAGDLSLTLRLDRIPAQFKDMAAAGLEQGAAAQRERQPGEDEAAYKSRLTGIKLSQDAFLGLIRDGKELALDVVIDPKAEFVGLALSSSALADTPYAASLRTLSGMKSKFRGLVPNSAIGGFLSIPLAQGLRDALNMGIDQGKAEGLEKAKDDPAQQKLLNDMVDALRPTLTADTLDMALSIQGPFPSSSGGDPTYALAAAMAAKGGKKIEAALLEGIKKSPDDQKKNLTLDAAKAADGTTVHKVTNLSDGKDPAPFGESTGYAAFRDDAIAIGVGKNGLDALNQALAAGQAPDAGPSPQVEFFVSASRAAGMAKSRDDQDAAKAAAAAVFVGPAAKKDRIGLTLQATGDAMTLRIGGDVPAVKFFVKLGEIAQKKGQ